MALDEGESLAAKVFIGTRLAIAATKLRLVVEEFELRRSARHVQEYHSLRSRRNLGRSYRE
jgi:hypothetical protein